MCASAPQSDPVDVCSIAPPPTKSVFCTPATKRIPNVIKLDNTSACIAKPATNTFPLEYINDSGAGRTIFSMRALKDQGVPASAVTKHLGPASESICFDTGGGFQDSAKTLGMSSNLLSLTEGYQLDESPLAVSLGQTVEQRKMPYLWIPGNLPFHVTNANKLKFSCPLKFRKYAERVDNFVPIFKENITLQHYSTAEAAANYLALPNVPVEYKPEKSVSENAPSSPLEESVRCQVCGSPAPPEEIHIDVEQSIPEVLVEGSAEEIVADDTVRVRA